VLVIAPHPDDETFGCGGMLATMSRSGASTSVAFLTDGGASHPSHPRVSYADVSALRRNEAQGATAALGVQWNRVMFLNARDGTLASLGEPDRAGLVEQLIRIFEDFKPDGLFIPCRDDGSSEHDAAFLLIQEALVISKLSPRVFEYPIWSIWNPTLLLGPLLTCRRVWRVELAGVQGAKEHAAALYLTQVCPIAPDVSPVLPSEFVSMLLGGPEFFFEH
jgi:LmbE family N-acetylglucosaminyl deacetylase